MFTVTIPGNLTAPRRYAVDVILGWFLGLEYRLRVVEPGCDHYVIEDAGRTLRVDDTFFRGADDGAWLTDATLPVLPLAHWRVARELPETPLMENTLPVLYGNPVQGDRYWRAEDGEARLGLDVFGGSFFQLSRYEEAISVQRDEHDRFPAWASVAQRSGFLHRPLVNEYLEVLWAAMRRLWPDVRRKSRHFRVLPSHDVDVPYYLAFMNGRRVARLLSADLLKRRSPGRACRNLYAWWHVQRGRVERDPYMTFEWIMDASDAHGLRSSFNFICGHTSPRDGGYSIEHPYLTRLLRRVHERGHEIGLHPSYDTYRDAKRLRSELELLDDTCRREGIEQERFGARQHYLRWSTPHTFGACDSAGVAYDSTLTFADQAGFRCGTCYEYPAYHLGEQRVLSLVERPLIVMDGSITDPVYMDLGTGERAAEKIEALKNACRRYEGDFTVLWHNSNLVEEDERRLYERAIRC